MIAFVAFLQTYAIWLYLLCAFGILFGFKMLADARHLARTTLFSLEQDRAGEQSYRAVILIVVFLLAIGGITTINALIAPFLPKQESPIIRGPTPTLAFVFPSFTPVPSATPTWPPPSETLVPTSTPPPVTPSPTKIIKSTPPAALPSTPAPSTPAGLPAPTLTWPHNGETTTGENKMNSTLTFQWKWDCEACALGPNDRFELTVTYVDRNTGETKYIVGNSPSNDHLSLGEIIGGGSDFVYQKAKEDTFYWSVQVKRGDQPFSPASDKWKFVWH